MAFTEEQIRAIEWNEGPLMVLGTPGSGKTTVIINRVNNLIYEHGVKPENILVITFTRAAAASMKNRFLEMTGLRNTDVRFGTFHSFFYWIVRTAYGANMSLSVLDENAKRCVIRELIKNLGVEEYNNDDTLRAVLGDLGDMACNMIETEYFHSRNMSDESFSRLVSDYKDYKKQHAVLDFDDMVTQCYKLLTERTDILEAVRKCYPYIMVDEYQDTNRVQYEILKLLAHPLDNIYVVGDDDQSIYGFRGARPDIMKYFQKEFPKAEIMSLSLNFRCPKEIVDFSSRVISENKSRFDKKLSSNVDTKGLVQVKAVLDASSQNKEIIRAIKSDHAKGIKYSDIAVLYRTNVEPRGLLYKLRNEGIPYSLRDAIPDISSNPYIKPIISYIRYARGDHSRSLFLDFMNKPLRYISRDLLYDKTIELDNLTRIARTNSKDYLVDNIRRLSSELRTISRLSPYAAVNYIRKAVDYDSYLVKQAQEKGVDKDEIFAVVEDFQDSLAGIESFDEMFEMLENTDVVPMEKHRGEDEVQLMTLHSAKGLEFTSVHIMNTVEGSIPYKRSKAPDELEEERRLLYVGITRSSRLLTLYVPEKIGERETNISRFIERYEKWN
ncbi:DNA helicase-2 / ATP-dependent DNA helicase PcrA [Lachnospiraceae bacterium NE2001]|nr:DNA helicase-2 / ATP-dependent DNA helicase PcrA [Lachnospiraceae bacterium NE2001]